MKKFFSVLLATVSGLTLLGSCSPRARESSSGGDVSVEEIDVNLDPSTKAEIEIMVPGGNSNEQTMIDCLIEDFGYLYPNVTISMSYVSVDNYVSAVNSQALAGTLPDIIWSNSPDFYDLLDSDIICDLTPYIRANEAQSACTTYRNEAGEPSKFDYANDFFTEFFDMGSKDGKIYVIPRSCDSVVTFINTEILEKAGVDLDPETTVVKNGWTWDEFMDVCEQVRTWMDANGMNSDYVFDANLTSWLSVCYSLLISYDAEVIDTNGNNVIDSANTRACLEMVRELVTKRYINDSTVATTGSFENGRSAMLFQSASVSLYAEKRALEGKLDLVSFPLVTENNTPKIGAGIAGYAINSKSKNKEIAWAFLTYLLSHQGQQNMANNGLNLASIRKDLSDPSVANWGLKYANLNLQAYTYGSEYKISTDFFVRTKLSAKAGIQQALKQMFNSASNASKNIDDIIKTAVADINDAMIDY